MSTVRKTHICFLCAPDVVQRHPVRGCLKKITVYSFCDWGYQYLSIEYWLWVRVSIFEYWVKEGIVRDGRRQSKNGKESIIIIDESRRENRYFKKYSFVCMNMCAPCVRRSLKRSEEASDTLELKLQMGVNHHVCVANQILVLCKSSKHS